MANWQRHLDLRDIWDSNNIPFVAKTLAERLRNLAPLNAQIDYERGELAELFAALGEEPNASASEFNALMSDLYDWADTKLDDSWNGKKVCWVATF